MGVKTNWANLTRDMVNVSLWLFNSHMVLGLELEQIKPIPTIKDDVKVDVNEWSHIWASREIWLHSQLGQNKVAEEYLKIELATLNECKYLNSIRFETQANFTRQNKAYLGRHIRIDWLRVQEQSVHVKDDMADFGGHDWRIFTKILRVRLRNAADSVLRDFERMTICADISRPSVTSTCVNMLQSMPHLFLSFF